MYGSAINNPCLHSAFHPKTLGNILKALAHTHVVPHLAQSVRFIKCILSRCATQAHERCENAPQPHVCPSLVPGAKFCLP